MSIATSHLEATMYSKVKILGHPVHPMLVSFPIALYASTLVAFIVYGTTGDSFWFRVGTVANWAGVVMAVVAALPGFIDWAFGIPKEAPAKSTGLVHMLLNVIALTAFIINGVVQLAQWDEPFPGAASGIFLSALGVALVLPAGFFGWKMVQNHHVGVTLTPDQERLEPGILSEPLRRGPPAPPLRQSPLGR
jgi:uncharacterized membrane protein